MTVGDKIKSNTVQYTITREIAAGGRPNANIYLCKDEKGNEFIAKHFYSSKPSANIALGKVNHYGRRRDGCETVFNEIREKNKIHEFVIDHIDRFKHNGKWVIIVEYIKGDLLRDFIVKNRSDQAKVNSSVIALANTLSEWHRNGFAHGDPHLDNCIIQTDDKGNHKVILIDYCLIHHKDFHYCKQYDCFSSNAKKRLNEDLNNDCGKLGKGFRKDLEKLEFQLGPLKTLSEVFDSHYKIV